MVRSGFYGRGFDKLLEAYEKAVRDGTVHVRQTMVHDDDIVMSIDPGAPGGDATAFALLRGHMIGVVIIDDPYNNVYEGEFREVPLREAMSTYARSFSKLPRARRIEKNNGPQPRTKYPRRR